MFPVLHRMGMDADGLVFIGWLRLEQAALESFNRVEKDEVLMRQRQGALQCITEILDRVTQAPSVVQKLRSA